MRYSYIIIVLVTCCGARSSTPNFVVETADPRFCQVAALWAETYRRDLAAEWLGQPLANWSAPCIITITAGENISPGGATTFVFSGGQVFGWRMDIQGPMQRVVDSVLPHEITHMILASYFKRPVPRWADEGAATIAEHDTEKLRYRRMLLKFLRNGRGIAMHTLVGLRDYPQDVMPMYAQGFSMAEYLVQQRGRKTFIIFLDKAMASNDWSGAAAEQYGLLGLSAVQQHWLDWVASTEAIVSKSK